jgi:hypothetical protein
LSWSACLFDFLSDDIPDMLDIPTVHGEWRPHVISGTFGFVFFFGRGGCYPPGYLLISVPLALPRSLVTQTVTFICIPQPWVPRVRFLVESSMTSSSGPGRLRHWEGRLNVNIVKEGGGDEGWKGDDGRERKKKRERDLVIYPGFFALRYTRLVVYIIWRNLFFSPWASTAARCAVFAYRYRIYAIAIYHTHTHTIQHTCTVEYCLRAVYSLLCFQGESIQQSLAFFPFFFFFSTLLYFRSILSIDLSSSGIGSKVSLPFFSRGLKRDSL